MTEAVRAVIQQVKEEGLSYITATHDVNNPHSGRVMQAVGMRYQYSYEEMWQPKTFWSHSECISLIWMETRIVSTAGIGINIRSIS